MSLEKIIKINRQRIGLDTADVKLDQTFSETSGATNQLCIYGRMRPDGPDAHYLADIDGEWAEVRFPGYLQNGAACSIDQCPGLAWTPGGTWNDGFLFSAHALKDIWESLDAKEGDELVRILTPVRINGTEKVANIYVSRDASTAQLLMLDGMNVHDDVDFRT